MPLILVVEPDEATASRLREAFTAEDPDARGSWRVEHARSVEEAMNAVAAEAPDLFVVATELEGAANVLGPFARRRGGPGTLGLAPEPESEAEGRDREAPAGLGADVLLTKPVSGAEVRRAATKLLETAGRPAARPGSDGPKLTSHDIFGELVAEVEREAREGKEEGGDGGPAPGPPAEPSARPARRATMDDDIERRLEQTLSGVLGPGASKRAARQRPGPQARPPADSEALPEATSGTAADRGPRSRRGGDAADALLGEEVDALLSKTLSGLELGERRKPPPVDREPPEEAPPPQVPSIPLEPPLDETPEAVGPVGAADEAPGEPPVPSPPPQPEPPPGDEGTDSGHGVPFGQYRLLERIGVGGMAEVWKARMTGVEGFQKTVAIKKILPHLTDSSDFVDMFIDEAKLAAQLNHANIIHIYDLGRIDGDYYIAMEYVEGENLRAILEAGRERGWPLPVGLALHVASRLASALDHAHRKRDFDDRDLELVHRDVSPQNVLIGYEGSIKLCDFGIVKAVSKTSHTRMGALKGKLQYMSPEQAWGRSVDGRSDIFSLGSLLFEMLTGRRLFTGENEMEVLEAVRECRVQAPGELDPGVPAEVDDLVLRALAADPDERFQSAGELARGLDEILSELRPTAGRPELSAYMHELFGEERELPGPTPAEPRTPSVGEPRARPAPGGEGTPAGPDEGEASLPRTPSEEEGVFEPEPPAAEAETLAPVGETAEVEEPAEEPAEEQAVEAVEPVAEVEPEEGGRRGKGLLVAAVLLALVAAAAVFWWVTRESRSGDGAAVEEIGVEVPVEAEEEAAPLAPEPEPEAGAEPGGSESDPAAGGEGEATATPGEGAQDPTAPEGTGGDARSGADAGGAIPEGLPGELDRTVEERLAAREEQLRREFEEKERELAAQLEEAQRAAAAAPEPAVNAEAGSETVPAPAAGSAEEPPGGPEPGAADGAGEPAVPGDAPPSPAAATAQEEEEAPASEPGPAGPAEPEGAGGVAEGARAEGASSEAPDVPSGTGTAPEPDAAARADGELAAPAEEAPPEPAEPPEPEVEVGELVRPGPGVVPPQLVTLEKPEYPPIARRLRVQGVVVIDVLVDENGDVIETRLEQSVRQKVGINEAALEAARTAKYRPATKDGVRVKMWTTIRIPFRL